MTTVTLTVVDPAATPPGRLESLLIATHAERLATAAEDQPYEPGDTLDVWRAALVAPWSGDPLRLLVAGDGDDRVLGHAVVELPTHDNTHLGMAELHVSGGHRRQGVGRALLEAAVGLLRENGRRTLLTEARIGSPMEAFAAAVGATCQLVDVRRQQPIDRLDPAVVRGLREDAARVAGGYRLEAWTGATPEHRRGHVAHVMHSLNDAPLGDLDYGDERWDADRVARRDHFVVMSGLRLHTVVAFAGDGTAAGFTEIAVSADGTYGWQWNTGVDPAHRGRRLGLLLKTTMVERLRAQEPALRTVSTWNAGVNDHMIAINDALGYVPVDRMGEWQLDL